MAPDVNIDIHFATDSVRAANRHSVETDLDPALLADIAAGLAAAARVDRLPADTTRRWTYLIEAERYEAIIIAWPPGTGLRMHDHGGSLAAVHMVAGRLRERFISADAAADAPLIETRWVEAGDTLHLPRDHTHEMINLDSEEAVSIHVYSPPLNDTDFRVEAEITLVTVPGR